MQNQRDDTIANIGTTPNVSEVNKTTTFSAGSPRFSLPDDTYELAISFEVANVNLTSNSAVGSSIFKLNLDSSMSDWLDKFQFWTIKDLHLDMQCTSPLGTSSGAVLVSYMTDPVNADVPTDPLKAKSKFGVTFPRVIIRPRDNKTLSLNVQQNPMYGNWRYVKRGDNDDPAAVRQSCFGTVVAIVNTQPAASDGANFTTWLQGTLVAKGRTEVTQGSFSRKIGCTIDQIEEHSLVQDELGYAVTLKLQTLVPDTANTFQLISDLLKEGVWPVVTTDRDFFLDVELVDDAQTQKITFQTPTMYISNLVDGTHILLYLPVPSHEEVFLLNPTIKSVSNISNVGVALYLDQKISSDRISNVAPLRRRKMLAKLGNKHTVVN